jgi:hypothetical protein
MQSHHMLEHTKVSYTQSDAYQAFTGPGAKFRKWSKQTPVVSAPATFTFIIIDADHCSYSTPFVT